MLEQFLNHIDRHNLCKITDKILLAVSGGMDSVTMFDLFKRAGFSVGVVHCNFQLRGVASDADQALVEELCKTHAVPFHVRRFATSQYAEDHGISIQMAARELRYQLFGELIETGQFTFLATAHHQTDSLETVILNLVRGTGIDGLIGIRVKNDYIIRPLLFASHETIASYALANKLVWREDESNNTDDYHRNFIRHQVTPKLKELNPNLEDTFMSTVSRMDGVKNVFASWMQDFKKVAIVVSEDEIKIDLSKLMACPAPEVVLWELIKNRNFNFSQCQEIVKDHQTGKIFFSSTHELLVNRGDLLVYEKHFLETFSLTIEEQTQCVDSNSGRLSIQRINKTQTIFAADKNCIHVDANKLVYPLCWRSWDVGDSFKPLGMNGTKKISDFLIDEKVSYRDKKHVTVLVSGDKIVWVIGMRLDDRFKISSDTNDVLAISFEKSPEKKVFSK